MTLATVENALRVAGKAWADANSLAFAWDNTGAVDPGAAPTLVWRFRPGAPEQLTDLLVRHVGTVEAELWVAAAGSGTATALQLAESLRATFAGTTHAGGEVLDEISLTIGGRRGASFVVDASLPWELFEHVVAAGSIGDHEQPTLQVVSEVVRERWEALVRAPLALRTFYDNSPPGEADPPPWAFVSIRLLRPVALEIKTIRVPGAVVAALNHPLGTGVQAANLAASAIERAFHQVTIRGIAFGTPVTTRVGRTPVDTWQTNVRLPFHYDVRT